MGRRYGVRAVNQAIKINGVSDLIAVMSGSSKVLRIHRWFWLPYDNQLLVAQGITTNLKVLTATVTNGSGGGAVTPRPLDGGDAAATFTARANDSTQATTNGSTVNHYPGWGHTYSGYGETPGEPVIVPPSCAGVLECLNASIQGAPNLSYFMEVEEIG